MSTTTLDNSSLFTKDNLKKVGEGASEHCVCGIKAWQTLLQEFKERKITKVQMEGQASQQECLMHASKLCALTGKARACTLQCTGGEESSVPTGVGR